MSIYADARPRIFKLLIAHYLWLNVDPQYKLEIREDFKQTQMVLNAHSCTYKEARTAGLSALYEHL
jgi:hypothetical protein